MVAVRSSCGRDLYLGCLEKVCVDFDKVEAIVSRLHAITYSASTHVCPPVWNAHQRCYDKPTHLNYSTNSSACKLWHIRLHASCADVAVRHMHFEVGSPSQSNSRLAGDMDSTNMARLRYFRAGKLGASPGCSLVAENNCGAVLFYKRILRYT